MSCLDSLIYSFMAWSKHGYYCFWGGGGWVLTDGLPFVRLIGDLHVWIVLSHLRNQLCRSEADCLDVVSPGGTKTNKTCQSSVVLIWLYSWSYTEPTSAHLNLRLQFLKACWNFRMIGIIIGVLHVEIPHNVLMILTWFHQWRPWPVPPDRGWWLWCSQEDTSSADECPPEENTCSVLFSLRHERCAQHNLVGWGGGTEMIWYLCNNNAVAIITAVVGSNDCTAKWQVLRSS